MVCLVFLCSLDYKIYNWFSDNLTHKCWDYVFKGFSRSCDGDVLFTGLLLYNLTGEEAEKDVKRITIGMVFTAGEVVFLKTITCRKRPDGSCFRFNSSFPSGHVAFASLLTTYFFLKNKKTVFFLFPWSVGVGLSRIYLKKHWFSDVIAGFVIGCVGGYFTYKYGDLIFRKEER